jgi:hypothetical protein
MPNIDNIEWDKRIRIVQEWLIDDWSSADIIAQINNKWGIEERQAKRYIAEARSRWNEDEDELVKQKRKRKIAKLQKLARSLDKKFIGTPAGIRSVLSVEKELINLEGLRPATKVELTGKDGRPIQTENSSVLLVLPTNGRELNHGESKSN